MTIRLGLKNQVTFFTEGRDDVPRFLFCADALLHPAYDETAGMVIIEAMLAGLPAIVTKNCGYAKYLEEHEAGIVLPTPFSQAALDEALVRLLTSNEREQWHLNGIAAKHQASLFQLVPKTVDFLQQFAQAKRPLLVFTLFRYFPYGGLQRDFMRVALASQAKGYDVVVYCVAWQGDVPEGFTVITVDVSGVSNHAQYVSFADYVHEDTQWRRPAAIIGFNRMPGLDLYYAADSCFEHKARRMRTPLYRRTVRYKIMSRFERAVFAEDGNTQVMLIAPSQREQFQAYYHTPDDRLHLLPPGVSQDRARTANWQSQRTDVRAEFGLADDDLLLVLVGSGFITKGLDRAVQALAALPDELALRTRMLVIGQDNPRQFLRLARSLEVTEKITVIKGRDDIPAILQAADLMVHPAYMESGGMVLIEAVIAGLPVIASAVCGFAHYIDDADAGVVLREPFEQEQLNQAVVDALRSPAQRATWSDHGVEFGQQHTELYDMPTHALSHIERSLPGIQARHSAALKQKLSGSNVVADAGTGLDTGTNTGTNR